MNVNLIRQLHGKFKSKNPSSITLKAGTKFNNGAHYKLESVNSHEDGTWNVTVFTRSGIKPKTTTVVMAEEKFLELKAEADMQNVGNMAHGMGKLPGIGTQHRKRQTGFHRATVFV